MGKENKMTFYVQNGLSIIEIKLQRGFPFCIMVKWNSDITSFSKN